jgi:hypothetical protein
MYTVRIRKSKINQRIARSIKKIGLVLVVLFLTISIGKVGGTNAFFTDKINVEKNTVSSGYWIPKLEMSVDPKNPDGDDGWYKTKPCVTLTASVTDSDDTKIYYRLKDEDSYKKYDDSCVEIPDGEWNFSAYAIFEGNDDWKSNIIEQEFKVDTSQAEAGDVVINEIMWMGSFASNKDEWIELRNTTKHDIDIKNWRIYGAAGGNGHIQIDGNTNNDYTIHAHGFFLISRYDKEKSSIDVVPDLVKDSLSFNDNYLKNGQVILQDENGNEIDSTPDASKRSWPKGAHGIIVPGGLMHLSMERDNDTHGWHTCNPLGMNHDQLETMRNYWDDGLARLFNCGTPRNANLSKNDPSSEDFDVLFTQQEENSTPAVDEEHVNSESEENPDVETKALNNNEQSVTDDSSDSTDAPADTPPAGN